MPAPNERIPVSVLTGFLGAGKSTLLNRILKDPSAKDTAVIINEFGEVGIDNLLVESSGDTLLELSNGCLCCTIRGELVETLASLIDQMQTGRIKPIRRVVIETTGLADPAPVMQAVMGHPVLCQSYQLDGVVTVVDAVHGLSTIDQHIEALKQVAVADRLVITKTSLTDGKDKAALEARLRALNPRAARLDGDTPDAGRISVLINGLYAPDSKIADVGRWLHEEEADHAAPADSAAGHHHHHHHDDHHHHHDDHGHGGHAHHGSHHHDVNRHGTDIRSFSIIHDEPIDPMAMELFIDLLRSAHGEKLLRMKAIVKLADNVERPLVLHGVQTLFHPPERLPHWPPGSERKTRMVLITQGLSEDFVTDLFAAFTGQPRIDRPDRAALADNPLAVPGFRR
ncbi:GTP-binding protein [Rhizobium sp. SSA_523]|uniref:CobW family GTP-binding protein n=1 Tax=Rhizobium sp. SSA_523 TaxID=2952477 RepID=UPI002090B98C|nr:GTP-binding protein [Rhizobium sp. SSA_523]MCO5733643.1 GTP-binding protein [Rhizobium sp. SSA_523]WKC23062.1 GTP-binding protein [Rhizobium sp. SSA_523]